MLSYLNKKMVMVDPRKALNSAANCHGNQPMSLNTTHHAGAKAHILDGGMGCFWGAEASFGNCPRRIYRGYTALYSQSDL